ncbi:MAG: diadenosine tetraphosphatase [Legionellales bacterium]|nr:diadenosine tetraphosphatase [Legionellales bacterium]|tara:strand:+ start:4218 stop:5024 length:807 start_codon:yes stop_codon:yes gene_type:complete
MATYAIGDVQGCYRELQNLLETIDFNPDQDTLWFTGDLVNRGPNSLDVLRLVKSLGTSAITVLGNHDLHMLAVHYGLEQPRPVDTFGDVLNAPDRLELCEWLRLQPIIHQQQGYVLVHAGIYPFWTLDDAIGYAAELEDVLRGNDYRSFFQHMYGDRPSLWEGSLADWDRLRFIVNSFTRMRFCDDTGTLSLREKGPASKAPQGFKPWFLVPDREAINEKILFGHWAALEGHADVQGVFALDTGCVWGNGLTAIRLGDDKIIHVHSID